MYYYLNSWVKDSRTRKDEVSIKIVVKIILAAYVLHSPISNKHGIMHLLLLVTIYRYRESVGRYSIIWITAGNDIFAQSLYIFKRDNSILRVCSSLANERVSGNPQLLRPTCLALGACDDVALVAGSTNAIHVGLNSWGLPLTLSFASLQHTRRMELSRLNM